MNQQDAINAVNDPRNMLLALRKLNTSPQSYMTITNDRKKKIVIPVRDENTNNVCTFRKKLYIEEMPF